MSRSPACRFYFQDRAAKTRSSVWKVWTGRKGEDVYVAPRRIAGELKLSIHRDGMNQIGYYSKQVKAQIRAADKHYLDRRPRVDVPYLSDGWTSLCTIVFNSQEFELNSPPEVDGKPTAVLNAFSREHDGYVIVLATDDRASAARLETPIIGELPRPNGGFIVLTWCPVPHDPSIVAAVDTDRRGFGWQAPGSRGVDEPYGFVYVVGNLPRFAEYSTRRHAPPPLVPHLPGLKGVVHSWSDAPPSYHAMDVFCAVLACSNDTASVYVDPRAHCDQAHLVSDTNDLIEAFRIGKIDDQWESLPDGRMVTGITMPATAVAAGLHGYLPNPLKG